MPGTASFAVNVSVQRRPAPQHHRELALVRCWRARRPGRRAAEQHLEARSGLRPGPARRRRRSAGPARRPGGCGRSAGSTSKVGRLGEVVVVAVGRAVHHDARRAGRDGHAAHLDVDRRSCGTASGRATRSGGPPPPGWPTSVGSARTLASSSGLLEQHEHAGGDELGRGLVARPPAAARSRSAARPRGERLALGTRHRRLASRRACTSRRGRSSRRSARRSSMRATM